MPLRKKLPCAAVKLIRARLGDQVCNRAGAAAELHRVVQRQYLLSRHRIQDGLIDRTPTQAFIGDPVDEESVEALSSPR